MSGDRKALLAVVVLALGAIFWYRSQVFSEPAQLAPPRIAFVTGGKGPYWESTIEGAEAAAKKLNVKLDIVSPEKNENLDEQLAAVESLKLSDLDGVAISPVDAEGEVEVLNKLSETVRIVTFDSDAPDAKRLGHVGTSNFSAGKACARLVGEAIPEGGKLAVFMANVTKENLLDRKGGFAEQIARMADDLGGDVQKYQVVGYYEDGGSDQKCVEQLDALLDSTPDLDCLVTFNARQGPLLLGALEKHGKLGEIQLITFDTNEETLAGIESGHVFATIAQDPYKFGYEAVNMLVKLCHGEGVELPIVGRSSLYIGTEAIRQANLADFRSRMSSRQQKN